MGHFGTSEVSCPQIFSGATKRDILRHSPTNQPAWKCARTSAGRQASPDRNSTGRATYWTSYALRETIESGRSDQRGSIMRTIASSTIGILMLAGSAFADDTKLGKLSEKYESGGRRP